MGFFDWLRRLFGSGGAGDRPAATAATSASFRTPSLKNRLRKRQKVKLTRFRNRRAAAEISAAGNTVEVPSNLPKPYRFARPTPRNGWWLDFSRDQNDARLSRFALPQFRNPEELARWLGIPLGQLAWLVHRFDEEQRPADEAAAHYYYRWIRKRTAGRRLIEAPKAKLKRVQQRILEDILDRVPPHAAAHGFVAGRSICTNARPHVGQRVLIKLDLEGFYPSVSLSRVTAIFRSLGYAREAAIWLGRLTTSALPVSLVRAGAANAELAPYLGRRLPQGAPTSPALANLSAFSLDLRLAGLARSFGARYTRYADDLTFSGDEGFLKSLAVFLPLVSRIVRAERFRLNPAKRKVIRSSQRQTVTGVVVNTRLNVARRDYDTLKAILTNCVRRGPSTQNHDQHGNFASHLLGRIAHVAQLNPQRGGKLRELYAQIDWNR